MQRDNFILHLELVRDKVPDWDDHPFNIPAIGALGRLPFERPVTFLVGENGSGKSTLIEAVAICAGFNPEGGSKNFGTTLRPSESTLHQFVRLARRGRRERDGFFLRAETMFNVSTEAEQYRAYGWENLHEMSHAVRYRDTEHYAVTKAFLDDPDRMLRRLFAETASGREE
jgi:predicted ATPase